MDELKELFRVQGQFIRIYPATEIIQDPFEKNVEFTTLKPIKIEALVQDLVASQIAWKMPGIKTSRVKEIVIDQRHISLIEQSHQIRVDDETTYEGWRENGKLQIRKEGTYARLLIYSKTVE